MGSRPLGDQTGGGVTDLIPGPSPAYAELLPEWRALWAQAPDAEPFSHPDWVQAYLASFEPAARRAVLTVRFDGALVAALPFVRESTTVDGMPVRLLRAPIGPHSFRAHALVAANLPPEAPSAIIGHLLAMQGWDLLTIPRFARRGFAEQVGRCAAEAGFPTLLTPHCPPSRWVAVREGGTDGEGEPWLAGVDPDLRKKMRRARRQIEQDFRAVPDLETQDTADPAGLQRFYGIEGSGWKGREGTAIACAPDTLRFYTEVAQAFAADHALRLHFLRVQGVTMAGAFSVVAGGRLYVLKWAYDEDYAKYRPGQLLSGEMLRDCAGRGVRAMDLGEDAPYKREWTPLTQDFDYLYIFNRTLYGRLLHAFRKWARPGVGRVLKGMRRDHHDAGSGHA